MLGKLIKHEWKETSRMGGIIMLTMAGMSLIGTLGVAIPLYFIRNAIMTGEGEVTAVFSSLAIFMSVMLYVLTFVGVSYGLMIYLSVRFYKTMYSEEGYLTHTLPVTPRQLLVSKTLVAGLWYLLVGLVIALSVGILLGAVITSLSGGNIGYAMELIWSELEEMLQENDGYGFTIIHGIVYMLAALIVTPFSTTMMLFGSLTVGQLFSKYRALMGILVYIGTTFVNSILGNLIRIPFVILAAIVGEESILGNFLIVFGTYDMVIIYAVGIAVMFYFISRRILERKLNLE